MSDTATRNLSREKLQQILASIGSQQVDESEKLEAAEYNWHQPHCFSSMQLEKLDNFTEKAVQGCAEKFTRLYHNDFNATVTSTTQHFAGELAAAENAQSDYYFTIDAEKQIFGMFGIPSQTAITWATQLLGDSKTAEDTDRDLSQLEQSLLFDIASGIIKALSDSYDDYDLRPAGRIVKGLQSIELKKTDEICKITFSVKETESEKSSEAYFLILCEKLKPVVGQDARDVEEPSSETVAKKMLDHVHKVPLSVTARLASTILTFEEVVSLQVDDILLLDKGVNEPVELTVEGKTIFRGQPVKSDNKHAVMIAELCHAE